MDFFCDKSIWCDAGQSSEGYDYPVKNFSSELPDREVIIGVNYGWDNNVPPLGTIYSTPGCVSWCTSEESQDAADLCAARQQILCLVNNPGDPSIPPGGDGSSNPNLPITGGSTPSPDQVPGTNLYGNDLQSCSLPCPDGTLFTQTVNSGEVVAPSKQQANSIANSLACKRANERRICISKFEGFACANQDNEYSQRLVAVVSNPPATWSSSGNLPPGLTLESNGLLHGYPSQAGSYTFTVTITNSVGVNKSQTMTFNVLGFTSPDTLTEGKVDHPYSYQLESDGGGISYHITFGSLPAGLTMNSSGLISGTPTSIEDPSFIVAVVDKDGNECENEFDLPITGPKFTNHPTNPTQCTAYNLQITTTPTPCTFSGTCPAGMKIDSNGLITGCPASPGPATFSITATDAQHHTNTQTTSVNVIANPPYGGYATSVKDLPWTTYTYDLPGDHSTITAAGGSCDLAGSIVGTPSHSHGQIGGGASVSTGLACCLCQSSYDLLMQVDWTVVDPGPHSGGGHVQFGIGSYTYSNPSITGSGSASVTLPAASLWTLVTGANIVFDVVWYSDLNDGETQSFTVKVRLTPLVPPTPP